MKEILLEKDGIAVNGVPSKEELRKKASSPSPERLRKKAVALIECIQEVPCDSCEAACPCGAIKLKTLTSLPILDEDACTGCGICIPLCPGLAIFGVLYDFSAKEALLLLPYECLPRPKIGSIVNATDRCGRSIAKVRVINVLERRDADHTAVISIAVPKKSVGDIRGIAMQRHEQGEGR